MWRSILVYYSFVLWLIYGSRSIIWVCFWRETKHFYLTFNTIWLCDKLLKQRISYDQPTKLQQSKSQTSWRFSMLNKIPCYSKSDWSQWKTLSNISDLELTCWTNLLILKRLQVTHVAGGKNKEKSNTCFIFSFTWIEIDIYTLQYPTISYHRHNHLEIYFLSSLDYLFCCQ